MKIMERKVKDMDINEFKNTIRETILEVIEPDYGLELREATISSLKKSLKEKKQGKGIPLGKIWKTNEV